MDHQIEINDNITIQEEVSIQAISSIWIYFPSQLSAIKKTRGIIADDGERLGINFLTITGLTSFLESIINETLLELIHPLKKESGDDKYQRILNDLENRICSSTFQKYNDILYLLTNKKLKDYTTDDTWECISHLFTFRNQIVHGKHFSYTVTYGQDDNEKFELSDAYKVVHEYFIKKLILTKEDVKNNSYYMLKNEMVDFFIEKTITFFIDFTKKISDEYKLSTYENMNYIRRALEV